MINRPKIFLASLLIAIFGGSSFFAWNYFHSLSGTYLAQSPSEIDMIRLVETDGGKLSGQLAIVIFNSTNGNIKNISASVDGTTDGKNINLSFNFTSLIPIPITAFGNRESNSIALTFGIIGEAPKTQIFLPSNIEAFQVAADALQKKSQKILAEKTAVETRAKAEQQRQNFLSIASDQIHKVQDVGAHIDATLKSLPQGNTRYHNITSKIQAFYERAQNLSGDRYSVPRNQIIVAMNQGVVATNQIDAEVQSIHSDFAAHVNPLLEEVTKLKRNCPSSEQAMNEICQKLQDSSREFQSKVHNLSDELKQLRETYKTELAAQQAMIDRAEQIP